MSIDNDVTRVFDEAKTLLLKKHADYGSANISAAPGGPLNGLRVRLWDKQARLNNLVDTGAVPQNESLRDTLVDMLNYAAIGLLVLDGAWPGVSPREDTVEPGISPGQWKVNGEDVPQKPAPFRLRDTNGLLWGYYPDCNYWVSDYESGYRTVPDRARLDTLYGPLTEEH